MDFLRSGQEIAPLPGLTTPLDAQEPRPGELHVIRETDRCYKRKLEFPIAGGPGAISISYHEVVSFSVDDAALSAPGRILTCPHFLEGIDQPVRR